jgi:hypothetical protein
VGGRPPAGAASRVARLRLDRFELAALAVFAALSLWVLSLDLFQVVAHGRVWTGTDGFYLVDQMQYLAWIRGASHHLLASNLFVLRDTPRDYFQPAVAISGVIAALGVAPWLALLLWKPVAVVSAFYGVRGYARRSLQGLWARRTALVLGLFFGSFTVIYGSLGVLGDVLPAFLSWGYTFGLLALAAMLFALLSYDRARRRPPAIAGARRALAWAPAVLGALASSLHPWQGELLILIILGSELILRRGDRLAPRPVLLPAFTVLVTAIPLAYYAILGRADLSWRLARVASKHSFSLLSILLALAPLLLPALLAYRDRPRSFLPAATRLWPVAALVIYLVSATSFSATPLHAFEGVTIPLSILAIEGLRRLRLERLPARRALAVLAVAAATIPATVWLLHSSKQVVAPSPGNANFIDADEHKALQYLAHDRRPGGVLTRFYLGVVVPAETGRRTFVGSCLWSQPNCAPRAEIAQLLFDGSLSPELTRGFVAQTGARFVLDDCQTTADIDSLLAPLTESVHRFGCATVYVLASPGPPSGPLAESPPNAALRASGRHQRRVQHS